MLDKIESKKKMSLIFASGKNAVLSNKRYACFDSDW